MLLQALIEVGILAVIMLVLGNAGLVASLLFPLLIVLLTLFSLGVGLALSVYNVFYRDVGYLVTIGMNLLFYATPIIYPITQVPEEVKGIPLRRHLRAEPDHPVRRVVPRRLLEQHVAEPGVVRRR